MASTFPGSIDNFTDPLSNSSLSSPSHAGQHSDLNDAVEKIETYMGLVKVIPTGATNGTVAANGTVTIGNAVSSVTVSGAFSSLYDIYLITLTGGVGSGAAAGSLKLGTTATGYYNSGYNVPYSGAASAQQNNNGTIFTNALIITTDGVNGNIVLNGPNLVKRTYYTSNYIYGATAGGGDAFTTNGYVNTTTQYTDFTVAFGGGTMTGGLIRVYGYRN